MVGDHIFAYSIKKLNRATSTTKKGKLIIILLKNNKKFERELSIRNLRRKLKIQLTNKDFFLFY